MALGDIINVVQITRISAMSMIYAFFELQT